jgi:hypothetical protein
MLGPTQAALLHVEQPSITQSRWIAAIFIGMVADKAGTCARAPWTRKDSGVKRRRSHLFLYIACISRRLAQVPRDSLAYMFCNPSLDTQSNKRKQNSTCLIKNL